MTEDRKFTIYTGRNRKVSLWSRNELTWPELRDRLTAFTVTDETLGEYLAMDRERQTRIKDVGGFVGGTLDGGIRKKTHLSARSLVTLDFDGFTARQLDELREQFAGVCWAVYSTHKHTPSEWRVRVVMPLSRDVDPEEYVALGRKIADMIGMQGIDRTTFEPCRMMFWPSRPCDADYIAEGHDGMAFLDPDRVLALYDDWRDPAEWPRTPGEADLFSLGNAPTDDPRTLEIWRQYARGTAGKARDAGSGMEDPVKKEGIVGAFCRTFTISAAIARFLPDTYRPYRDGRYTYTTGSTLGGAVVYEDKWIFSNHATDPAAGRELNAWDLVRVHRFGHLDASSRSGSVMSLPSSKAMTDMALEVPEVRRAMAEESRRRGAEAFAGIEVPEPDRSPEEEWSDREAEMRDRKGRLVPKRTNICAVLRWHPALAGKIRFNEFAYRLEVSGELPWKRPGDEWFSDTDAACLRAWLEATYDINAKERVNDAVELLKGQVRCHPVREYFEGLQWDGVSRLERLIPDVLGAADTRLNRTLSAMIFVAAVARVFRPGVKYDTCVTLFGPEGCGKSSMIALMAGEWFTDSLVQLGTKDSMQSLHGKLLVELGEMSAVKRADVDAVKNFISSQCDTYRPAFGRLDVTVPRQCVFVATTNDRLCLRGYGDNRRFPVVEVRPDLRKVAEGPWGYIPKWRDQLWAEAVSLWREGFPLWLAPDLAAEAREIGAGHSLELDNAAFDLIDAYLERPIPDNWKAFSRDDRKQWIQGRKVAMMSTDLEPRRQVCVAELLTECLDLRPGSKEYTQQSREVARYMDRTHPEWRRVYHIPKDPVFGRVKGWVRDITGKEDEGDLI